MSPRPKSNTHTSITTFMFHVVHPGSGVYLFSHILFYDIQYLTLVNVLSCSIYGVDNNAVDYDDCSSNNNATNNDTPGATAGVENGTIRYGNNNINCIDIYGEIVVNIAYDSVPFVATLDTISSSSKGSCVRLSSEIAPTPFSSNISRLSSDLFHLSSDFGIVHHEHYPVALVASLETIPSLSSPDLSPVLKSLCNSSPGLYSCPSSSHAKCPSSISFSVPSTEPSFEPSIAQSYLCFTRSIYDILFLKFHTESFLSYSYDHIHDHGVVLISRIQPYYSTYLFITHSPYCLLSITSAPFGGQPLCTSESISGIESYFSY